MPLALLAVACSSNATGAAVVTDAASHARGRATMSFEVVATTETAGAPPVVVRIEGSVDLPNDVSTATVTIDGTAAEPHRCRLLRDRERLFATVPGAAREEHGEKAWTVAPRGSGDPLADAAEILVALGTAGEARELGDDVVRGVRASRYRTDVGTVGLIQASSVVIGDEAMASIVAGLGPTLAVDAWIDAEGLPRRLVWEWDLGGATRTEQLTTVELFAYGEDVEVAYPPMADADPVDDVAVATATCLGA